MDQSTLLLRQIHPVFVDATGKALSAAFTPTSKDTGKLSVYDGDRIEPAAAFDHYTSVLGLKSVGALGVSVEECALGSLIARPDPLPDFQEHAVIDFSGLGSRSLVKSAAKLLCYAANKRGWLLREMA